MVPTLDPVEDLFIGTPTWEVPPIEDRFAFFWRWLVMPHLDVVTGRGSVLPPLRGAAVYSSVQPCGPPTAAFATALAADARQITDAELCRLLEFEWRARLTAAWLNGGHSWIRTSDSWFVRPVL